MSDLRMEAQHAIAQYMDAGAEDSPMCVLLTNLYDVAVDRAWLHSAWVDLLDGPDETPEGLAEDIRDNLDYWVQEYRLCRERG